MLDLKDVKAVYLACGHTDMRRSINGLATTVQLQFELDPFSPALFVFCNKDRNKLKILYWYHNGFYLIYRRLERGRFKWPNDDKDTVKIDLKELKWLLDGYEVRRGKAFKEVKQRSII
jgi:transposase